MENWARIFIFVYLLGAFLGSLNAFRKVRLDKNNYGLTGIFKIYGAFVWADLIIFGPFWIIVSFICLFPGNSRLFVFVQSVFWAVRSAGETIYWFNQQFSEIDRNPVKNHFFAPFFHNDKYAVWFVAQIFWQCVTVMSVIAAIYFGRIWITGL